MERDRERHRERERERERALFSVGGSQSFASTYRGLIFLLGSARMCYKVVEQQTILGSLSEGSEHFRKRYPFRLISRSAFSGWMARPPLLGKMVLCRVNVQHRPSSRFCLFRLRLA